MTQVGMTALVVFSGCAISAVAGDVIARQKQAEWVGFWLGLLLGPLGVVAACFIDRRPNCPHCGGRINATPAKRYPICPHCKTELSYQTAATGMVTVDANELSQAEAPWSFRYPQIGMGIATFVALFLWLLVLTSRNEISPEEGVPVRFCLISFLAALAGGAMAVRGAARNWLPQGLGVAAGVLAILLVLMPVLPREKRLLFLIVLLMTSGLAIVGAYIKHLVVKPTRIPTC